jgi:hypothetical protein
MTMRGRRPAGPEIVEQLHGSAQARLRLRVVLETLAGQRRVQEACQLLGIGTVRFHALRQTVLSAALAALEPRPIGRPPRQVETQPQAVQALAEQVDTLNAELEAARLREEVVLLLGGREQTEEKKTPQRRPRPRASRTRRRPTTSG